MQMPRCLWYWALQQAVFVMNCLPFTVSQILTSSLELIYDVKPDYILFFGSFLLDISSILLMVIIILLVSLKLLLWLVLLLDIVGNLKAFSFIVLIIINFILLLIISLMKGAVLFKLLISNMMVVYLLVYMIIVLHLLGWNLGALSQAS